MYIINNINLRTSYRLKKNSIKKKSELGRLKVRGEQENWMHVKCLYKLEHRCPWITGKVLSCHMGDRKDKPVPDIGRSFKLLLTLS